MTSVKAKAIEAAERALGPHSPAIVFGAFVRGYVAGHSTKTRWASKHMIRKPSFTINGVGKSEKP